MNFLGMGPLELLFIMVLALMVFGPDKLPDLARQIGKVVAEVRRITSDVSTEINRTIQIEPEKPAENPPRNAFVRPIPPPDHAATHVQPNASTSAAATTTSNSDEVRPPY